MVYCARELRDRGETGMEEREIDYEPPAIELVLTSEDLDREVQYAGIGLSVN